AGYDLAGADGTFELLLRETLSPNARFFNVLSYEVTTRMTAAHDTHTAASVTVEVDEAVQSAGATGTGPVCALDSALRQCLAASYPAVVEVRLTDYKVRVLEPGKGTAAKVRVLVEWTDGHSSWTTAGVSANVIEASWLALTDSLRLELLRLVGAGQAPVHIEDYSWAV
ncbi:MAG: citramalate synthase, partial [Chloroflexi bacterium]|nr:citramalate synthase [Chloroflexota bacterium]